MEKSTIQIAIKRQASISLLGNKINPEIVWIATHGYGMLAEFFIDKFNGIISDKHLVIAPEGLSKFYLEGLTGRVGATWMTSKDRASEIQDYIAYLEEVYSIIPPTANAIILLGFSQGVSTISRWFCATSKKADMLIAWGAAFPEDVLQDKKMCTIPTHIYIGKQDEYIPEEKRMQYLELLKASQLPIEVHLYEGKHQLDVVALKELVDNIENIYI